MSWAYPLDQCGLLSCSSVAFANFPFLLCLALLFLPFRCQIKYNFLPKASHTIWIRFKLKLIPHDREYQIPLYSLSKLLEWTMGIELESGRAWKQEHPSANGIPSTRILISKRHYPLNEARAPEGDDSSQGWVRRSIKWAWNISLYKKKKMLKVLKGWWGHIKRAQDPAGTSSHWPNLGQFEYWNKQG